MKPISQILFLIVTFCIPTSVLSQPATSTYWEGFAVVDYEAPLPSGSAERLHRQRVNSRYDKQSWVISVSDRETGGVGRVDEGPPPLHIPSDESTLIATGFITASTAYLSNDKSGVYTEFIFRINEVIKNDSANSVAPGASVMIDRAGGAVRYKNGHKLFYQSSDHALPTNERNYLLFLKRDGESPNYRILNGYLILADRFGKAHLEYDGMAKEHEALSVAEFIAVVRREMANPVYRRIDVERADDCPVRIESVSTGYGPITIGQKFPAGTDWLKQFTVTVSNTGTREIDRVEATIVFPRGGDKKYALPDHTYEMSYGRYPNEAHGGYIPPRISPGGRADLEVGDFDYRVLAGGLHRTGYADGAREARVQIASVTFADGSVWRRAR